MKLQEVIEKYGIPFHTPYSPPQPPIHAGMPWTDRRLEDFKVIVRIPDSDGVELDANIGDKATAYGWEVTLWHMNHKDGILQAELLQGVIEIDS